MYNSTGSIFILKLANFWNLWFFENWANKINIFNKKQKQTQLKVYKTNFDAVFDFYFNFTFS